MYALLRACTRLALYLFFGRIRIDLRKAPPEQQVLLLAANHPNSFLDALVIATHLPQRMSFLARGDAFRHPLANRMLRALYMTPVFRMREGRSDLRRTGASFRSAHADLERGRSVLVFAEGVSVNAPGLRPLGKGAARIAHGAWTAGLDVAVLPVWIEYHHFRKPFAEVVLRAGLPMMPGSLATQQEARFLKNFNHTLRERLMMAAAMEKPARSAMGKAARALLWAPALAGLVLHAPWYHLLRAATGRMTRGTVFFDSVLFSLLFFSYPLWLLMLAGIGRLFGLHAWAWLACALAPMTLVAARTWSGCR